MDEEIDDAMDYLINYKLSNNIKALKNLDKKNIHSERKNLEKYEAYMKKVKERNKKIEKELKHHNEADNNIDNSNIIIQSNQFKYTLWIILTIIILIFTIRLVMKQNINTTDIIVFIIIGIILIYYISKYILKTLSL